MTAAWHDFAWVRYGDGSSHIRDKSLYLWHPLQSYVGSEHTHIKNDMHYAAAIYTRAWHLYVSLYYSFMDVHVGGHKR